MRKLRLHIFVSSCAPRHPYLLFREYVCQASAACVGRERKGARRESPAELESSGARNHYPYDPTGDPTSEAFDYLRASEREGKPHIPTFALRTLERLRKIGLLHRRDTETPSNIRRVRFAGKQDLWIRFGTRRTQQGYKAVEVMDTPRSDKAILAAMVAWTSDPVDFEQLWSAIAYIDRLASHKEL